jgi:hypothetical protein
MPKVRNLAPEPRVILGRLVDVDEVFEVDVATFKNNAWPEDLYEVLAPTKKDKE